MKTNWYVIQLTDKDDYLKFNYKIKARTATEAILVVLNKKKSIKINFSDPEHYDDSHIGFKVMKASKEDIRCMSDKPKELKNTYLKAAIKSKKFKDSIKGLKKYEILDRDPNGGKYESHNRFIYKENDKAAKKYFKKNCSGFNSMYGINKQGNQKFPSLF